MATIQALRLDIRGHVRVQNIAAGLPLGRKLGLR